MAAPKDVVCGDVAVVGNSFIVSDVVAVVIVV
jgi:hypothetical protein